MTTEIERKPLEFYLELKYPITIIPDITGGYVAEIEDLPGCYTQGETLEETYTNMEESLRLWLESAYEDGLDIPLPEDQEQYSGKFFIRAPKSLHRKLSQTAKKEGVSLNQFLISTLSEAVGQQEASRQIAAQSGNVVREAASSGYKTEAKRKRTQKGQKS